MDTINNMGDDGPVVYEHITLVMPGVVYPGQSDQEIRERLEGYAEQHVDREFRPTWQKIKVKHGSIEYVPIVPEALGPVQAPSEQPVKIALLKTFIYWEP
jgi:hypothetical protein